MNAKRFAVPLLVALAYAPSQGWAVPILGDDLATFAVLGATPSVTNTGATTLTGDVGISPAASITGLSTITVNGTNGADAGNPFVHLNDATAISAQGELTTAITNLNSLGVGTTLGADLTGLTLGPGIYTVPAGTSNLTGTLTLDGLSNANAFWLFQMESSLITSPGSVVSVINTGPGAGVFWNVRSDATLDTTTSFQGNILALQTIALKTGATIGCGRALSDTAAVTMDTNTIGTGCAPETGGAGSNGFAGTVLSFVVVDMTVVDTENNDVVVSVPGTVLSRTVPEPGILVLFGIGLLGLGLSQRRKLRLPK